MSDEPSADAPVDFDRAEFSASADAEPACASCNRPLGRKYFTINTAATCEDCHHLISSQLKEAKSARAFVRAAGLGALAAIGGSIVWYAVAKITGMELGLIAIAIGYVVGKAVRRGSKSPGGRRYQALAMLLTYMSITGSYVPLVVKTLSESAEKQNKEDKAAAATLAASASPSASAASSAATAPGEKAPSAPPAAAVGLVQLVFAVVFVIGIALVAPFLGGASNIIGLALIGIALYEAWKFNRTVPVIIEGPLRTAKGRKEAPAASSED